MCKFRWRKPDTSEIAAIKSRAQDKESAKSKITMPVLVLGGDIYPALGGDYPGNFALNSTKALATNVTGITVPLSGH
jgi:hypothetical protein